MSRRTRRSSRGLGWTVAVLLLGATAAARAQCLTQENCTPLDSGCKCSSPHDPTIKFYYKIFPSGTECHLECYNRSFSVNDDLRPLNLPCGNVSVVYLQFDKNSSASHSVTDVLSALNVSSELVALRLNAGQHRFSDQSFQGLAAQCPRMTNLSLLSLGGLDEGLLAPLSGQLIHLEISNGHLKHLPPNMLGSFPNLTHLTLHNLELSNISANFFQPVGNSLVELHMKNLPLEPLNELPSSLFQPLGELRVLDLTRIDVKELPHGLLANCPKLETFVMLKDHCQDKNNCKRPWNTSSFLSSQKQLKKFNYSIDNRKHVHTPFSRHFFTVACSSLETLTLRSVEIQPATLAMLKRCINLKRLEISDTSLQSLDLRGSEVPKLEKVTLDLKGAMNCTCEAHLTTLKKWQASGSLDSTKLEFTCQKQRKSSLSDALAMKKCETQEAALFKLYGYIAAIVVLTIVVAMAVIWRRCLPGRTRIEQDPGDEYPLFDNAGSFDAFISYADHDEYFASMLIRHLEAQDFRVCHHKVHFIPAEPVLLNIKKHVQNSRCLLLLLSPQFLASTWCLEEIREAVGARKKICVVYRSTMSPGELQNAPQLIREYVERHTYLQEGDDRFYEKLVATLQSQEQLQQPQP